MDELPKAILAVISDYENNPQSRQPEKVIYKIKEIIMKNQIDLKLIRESGLWNSKIKYLKISKK